MGIFEEVKDIFNSMASVMHGDSFSLQSNSGTHHTSLRVFLVWKKKLPLTVCLVVRTLACIANSPRLDSRSRAGTGVANGSFPSLGRVHDEGNQLMCFSHIAVFLSSVLLLSFFSLLLLLSPSPLPSLPLFCKGAASWKPLWKTLTWIKG